MPEFCPGCGKAIADQTIAFCPGCGRRLGEDPAAGPGPVQPTKGVPGTENGGKRPGSSRKTALLAGGIVLAVIICAGIAVFVVPALTGAPGPGGAAPPGASYTGFVPYTSAADRFTVEVPQGWYVSEDAVANHPSFFLSNVSVVGATLVQQEDLISISSPDAAVHTLITGMDTPGPGTTGITDSALVSGFLDQAVAGVERSLLIPAQYYAQTSASVGQQYTEFVPTTFAVTKDPAPTTIGGMTALHATLLPENNKGQVLNDLEITVIRGKNAVYFVENSYSPDEANNTAITTPLQTMLGSFRETS